MTTFWMMIGLMTVIAMFILLRPIFTHGSSHPLSSKLVPIVLVVVFLPLSSFLLYSWLGNPKAVGVEHQQEEAVASDPAHTHELSPDQIIAMTQRLEQRLRQNPRDADGWAVLARSYGVLKRYGDSSAAYARALEFNPDNAQLLADYADTLAMANGRSLLGKPEQMVMRALKADPNNLKALALAGTISYERKDYQGAIQHWQKIIDLVPPESPIAGSIGLNLVEVRKLAGLPPQGEPGSAKAALPSAKVSGRIEIAPSLKARASPDDTVFIFARAAGEKHAPPLAILRKSVRDLPFEFTLDDSMAMDPQFKLSSVSQVVIGARVSRTGNAMPTPGDLEGFSGLLDVNSEDAVVAINSVVK